MLPRPATTLALLFLAMVTNVAATWVCATWPDDDSESFGKPTRWPVPVSASWPAPTEGKVRDGFGTTSRLVCVFNGELSETTTMSVVQWELSYGVPFRALRATTGWTSYGSKPKTPAEGVDLGSWGITPTPMSTFRSGLASPWRTNVLFRPPIHSAVYRLPLDPLPLGFALNTLFFFAVFLAAMMSLSAARRAWRRRRGRCPDCNYDLSSSADRCPECGRRTACSGEPGVAPGP